MKLKQQPWYQNVAKSLYVMDAALLIFFILALAPKATGIDVHEWVSVALLVPFIAHLMAHWPWITKAFTKIFKLPQGEFRFNFIWDLSLYLMVLLVMLSGILVSESALPALGIFPNASVFWHSTHHNLSNLLMPMLGVHLAMHWPFIRSISVKIMAKRKRTMDFD